MYRFIRRELIEENSVYLDNNMYIRVYCFFTIIIIVIVIEFILLIKLSILLSITDTAQKSGALTRTIYVCYNR